MSYHQQIPFYMAYPFFLPAEEERDQEKEVQIMKSYYAPRVMRIQEKVEQECDRMEYDGSMMFDEYPDKFMVNHLCEKIKRELEDKEDKEDNKMLWEGDLIGVLLFNEMFRRRCRRRRYCPYF